MKLLRRIITIVCIVATFIATAGEELTARAKGAVNQPTAAELQLLQGTWEGVMVGQEKNGNISITITGNSLHFHRDTNFWFETTFTLPVGTDPKQLQATIKDCAPGQESSVGKVVGAIFKIEDGTLTLVAIGDGDEETPKSFEATEGKGARYELRKVQPQKKNTEPPKTKMNRNNSAANALGVNVAYSRGCRWTTKGARVQSPPSTATRLNSSEMSGGKS